MPIEAIVASPLTISPNPLLLGVLKKGQGANKQLVIRSTAAVPVPFKITAVRSDDPRFEAKPPDESKTMHLLPISFTGAETEGHITAKLRLETDLPNTEPVEVKVNVQVRREEIASVRSGTRDTVYQHQSAPSAVRTEALSPLNGKPRTDRVR